MTMPRLPATRAREPDVAGLADNGGVRIAYESFGTGEQTLLFLPSWTLVNQRQWKAQVPYFARHCRVVTFDPRGNGGSDRPEEVTAYTEHGVAGDALAVLDALGIEQAAFVSLSGGAVPSLIVAAEHPERVTALAFIGPAVPLALSPEHDGRVRRRAARVRGLGSLQPASLATGLRGLLPSGSSASIFPEPHSTRQIESGLEWAARHDRRAARQDGRRGAAERRGDTRARRPRALPRARHPR